MRVSDYIVKSLEDVGIKVSFTLTGGFAMHLNDSFGKSKGFKTYYNHHEQACGYAALGYTKTTNVPSVVCTTSGIAATNAISPCLDAFQDSVSILFLSGQVKTFDTIRSINSKTTHTLRNYAFSDCDIISMVSSITKYSHEITCVEEVKTVMEHVLHNLLYGRPGPVWISIPLDIQGSIINSEIPGHIPFHPISVPDLSDLYALLQTSKRPIILAGNGIKLGSCQAEFTEFIEKLHIPVVTSYLGADLIESASPYFAGRVGLYADRCGNFSIQNSDLVISLGCRLSQAIVGYNPKTFAREARIVCVDIDPCELEKNLPISLKIHSDLNSFFDAFSFTPSTSPDYSEWLDTCRRWKSKWLFEVPPLVDSQTINPYHAVKVLYERLPENKITTTGAGSIAIIVNQLVNIKRGDTFIWSGHGDMGTDLPMSIGSHISSPTRPFILFTSEGTLQFNLQELQTIVHHKFPIKIIVFNNASYGAIEITQKTFFKEKFGVDLSSGLSFPDTGKLASAYGLKYIAVRVNEDLESAITEFLSTEGPVIFEIFCCIQTRYPKLSSKKNEDGTFSSLPYEDMEPFLPRDEFLREMIVRPLKESM
jgi:acetolactate synthase-1/2/3 large subunit